MSYSLYIQGLSKFHAIAGIINCLFCNQYLTILLVTALLAEHSFWFSGYDMKAQLSHAIKFFKSQKHITISILKAQVEIAFNNAIDKEDPAWLIQWIISHKLVCDIIFNFLFQTLIYWSGAQIVLLFPSVKHQTIGCYFFHLYLYSTNSSSDMNDTLVSDPQNHNRKTKPPVQYWFLE